MNVDEGQEDPMRALSKGIDPTNYAQDLEKVARFQDEVVSLMPQIEAQRVLLEQRWNNYHHVWARKNTDDSRFYTGVNDAYFPVAFSNIETLVAYLTSALFPAGPKFAVKPSHPMVPPAVTQKIGSMFSYFLYIAEMEEQFREFVRQGVIYGPTMAKVVWRDETVKSYVPQVVPAMAPHPITGEMAPETQPHPTTGQPVPTGRMTVQPMMQETILYRGPTFHVVDMTTIYLHPYNARKLEDCTIIFEKIDRDVRAIKGQEGRAYLNTEKLDSPESTKRKATAERRDSNQDFRNEPYGFSTNQITNKQIYTINEIWFLFDLYNTGYLLPCKAVVCNGVVFELRQNPYWHQRPPYLLWRAIKHMDHIYGMGWMEIGEHHQYTLNALINQALDSNLYQANQMMAVDADRYQGRLADIQFAPLAVMPFSGPGPVEDAVMFHKPESSAAEMFAAANIVAGSLQDSFGTPPVVQGKMSNKERTATEVNAVAQGASVRIDGMARDLGLTVMQRWMEMAFALVQQFCPPELDLKVTGLPQLNLQVNDVLHTPFFQWLLGAEAEQFQMMQAAQMQMQQAQQMNQQQIGAGNEPAIPGQQSPAGPSDGIGGTSFGGDSGPGA